MASMVSPRRSRVEREGEISAELQPDPLLQRNGLKSFCEGLDGGNLLCCEAVCPQTSVEAALKTSPAMWNTQQSTPASHKLQSRVSPAAAPPLLQVMPCTSCALHILPPTPRTTQSCPLPSLVHWGTCSWAHPSQGFSRKKKGIPAPQPSRKHPWVDQTELLA